MSERPSRRGNRPNALDISFGIDPDDSTTTSDTGRKRDRDDPGDSDIRNTKRRNHDGVPQPARKYDPRSYEVLETKDLVIFGEEPNPPDDGLKRTRLLSRFAFFDAAHDNVMVPLDVLKGGKNDGHRVLGAGFTIPKYDIDSEDEGQEDGFDENTEYIRLSRVLNCYTRYWAVDSPFCVETDHAIYEINFSMPSKKYRSQFRPFWRLQTILRSVISSAANDPEREFTDFMREYTRVEVLDQPMTESELWDAVPKLRKTLENVSYADNLRRSKLITYLLSLTTPVLFKPVGKRKEDQQLPMDNLPLELRGNPDTAALNVKIPTHVTSRISQIALPLFREVLRVVAPRPSAEPEIPKAGLDLRLRGFLERSQNQRHVQFRPDQRIGRSRWLKHILIDGVKYEVGDTILFYPGKDIPPDPSDLPPTDTLADHFWFAKIIQMREDHETVHVQWFEHSSKTLLQELGSSQELFLTNICDTLNLSDIIATVSAHYINPEQSLADVQPLSFFYRYMWDAYEGTFTNVAADALAACAQSPPPDNCLACRITTRFDRGLRAEKIHLGAQWHGVDYHTDDCVFIKAEEGPCHIGQITEFSLSRQGHGDKVVVRLFGRIDRIGARPVTTLKDERHLFYTNDEMTIPIENLIGICFVVVKRDMPELDAWLAMSPNRFYVKYRFPSLNVTDWGNKHQMHWDDLPICPICVKQDFKKFKGMKMFSERAAPLRVIDPFGGTGAFGLAMEEVGCFKLTHAVEIMPSAAETLKKNSSPDIKVYNQCSNLVLRHAILTHENKNPEPLRSIMGDHVLPPPPKPGDVDCLIAGFPCQPHSTLNMFQKANDRKSSLILTALSYVDFLNPPYCIFENVRGFLRYNLRARQDGKHSVKGGIPMGGLKLVAAALLDMGYQLRCGLLQAAHYGTPQTRVRFFLIAAKRGLELPPFPQPTHDFPVLDSLDINVSAELTLRPITTLSGVAPHRYVSVHDAISDLPKFDWKHPKKNLTRRQLEESRTKECVKERPWCGFRGPNVEYEHEPQTTFQKKCRTRPTQDIQHYTRTYGRAKVERIVEIPLDPDADYRHLRPDLWEWQFANPASATARKGFRPGFYGRVQQDGWFQTTVTNVDPTAKQCRVIHPYSKRILTVRELARSQGFPDYFVFYAKDDHVVTMHRQIGNAVPWPVSVAIAREFREVLYRDWVKRNPGPDEPAEVEFTDDEVMQAG